MIEGKNLANLTNLKTVLPQPAKIVGQSRLICVATITHRCHEATLRKMQNFSTYRIVDRLQTITLFLDVASRAPHESWWMGPEVLTIAIICFATPLFSY